MLFTEPIFLFVFFPIVLSVYLLLPPWLKNVFLLLASLIFYAWGEPIFVLLMLFSILFNFLFGRQIARSRGKLRKRYLIVGVIINLIPLLIFKYGDFIIVNISTLLSYFGYQKFEPFSLPLPIGISFYTFMSISYLVDIYRRDVKATKKIIDYGLYITMFPHLIAGPIVRFKEVKDDLVKRVVNSENLYEGIKRFIYGMFKKVVIANTMALIADEIFALEATSLYPALSWLGLIAYALQIYFDFSGYSDMAIGLGRMFGFHFPENFNYPYISTSITEFWRRWHITLSRWFRDYLYIPLGGNRVGNYRQAFNIMVVFLLTGLWHGASWTFVIWGGYYGVILVIEKTISRKYQIQGHTFAKWVVTSFLILIGWVFFRSDTLGYATSFIRSLFVQIETKLEYAPAEFLDNEKLVILILALLLALNIGKLFDRVLERFSVKENVYNMLGFVQPLFLLIIFLYAIMAIAASTHNPFIYYRF